MTVHQGPLFAYALSLLGDRDAANEVLQETNVVLWKQWREIQPGTNFKAWAFRVAHFQVMAIGAKLNASADAPKRAELSFWVGRLDEIAVFNHALPREQIHELYQLGNSQ